MPLISREIFLVTRKLSALATLSVAIVAMAGCSIRSREPAVLRTDTTRALPLGIPNARFFADAGPQAMVEEGERALEREETTLRAAGNAPGKGA